MIDIKKEFKPQETTISIGGKKMKFATLNEREQKLITSIAEYIKRTFDKILRDISEERILEATIFSRKIKAEDYLDQDNSFRREPITSFSGALLEGFAQIFHRDKHSREELRSAYESGFKIGYDHGVVDASRESRNPLSHMNFYPLQDTEPC